MKGEQLAIKDAISRIADLVEEINKCVSFKKVFLQKYEQLNKEYQKTSMSYKDFERKLKHLLEGKTKHEWISFYDSNIYLLYKKIDYYNDYVKQIILNEDLDLVYVEPENVKNKFLRKASNLQKDLEEKAKARVRKEGIFTPHRRKEYLEVIERSKVGFNKKVEKKHIEKAVEAENKAFKLSQETVELKPIEEEPHLKPKAEEKKIVEEEDDSNVSMLDAKEIKRREKSMQNDKAVDINSLDADEELDDDTDLEVKPFYTKGMIGKIFSFFFKDDVNNKSFLSKDVNVGTSLLTRERMSRISTTRRVDASEFVNSNLTKEAIRLRNIMKGKERLKRSSNNIGSIANIMVRNLSTSLIKNFPGIFEILYNGLRLANVNMLSNTYVNIMIFATILMSIFSFVVLFGIFTVLGLPFIVILVRSLLLSLIGGGITFLIFFGYPFNKIKERRTNIKTNMSFAISHMAAVAGSGVSPFTMFELLSSSPEYGEVTKEIQKIVDYVNLFGYDLIIATKSVIGTTPSPEFKEFLSGLVSSIESGGELKDYLVEKSKEALTNYQLERQKFNQVISTYSDIYTGILIAAPLFFISSLSLVGLLGGKIGGFDAKVLIGAGIYLIIPIMNVMFITFLEMTQPEV